MDPAQQEAPRRAGRQALNKLLRAYECQQVTWHEMQQRFTELVNLYGDPDGPPADSRRFAGARRSGLSVPAQLATQNPTGEPETVAEIRPIDWDQPLPVGWQATSIRWKDRDLEVAYDPTRISAVMTLAEAEAAARRSELHATGWLCWGRDRTGSELWLKDRRAAAVARLDEMRHNSASIDAPESRREPPEVAL